MWEQSLCESGAQERARSRYLLLASAAGQALVLSAAVILPLTREAWMPKLESAVMPPLELAIPAPAPPRPMASAQPRSWQVLALGETAPQVSPPAQVSPVATPMAAPQPGTLVVGTGAAAGLGLPAAPAVAPPPEVKAAPEPPVARGGEVEAALCLACPAPVYPTFAREAHIEGTVILEAVIAPEGKVSELRVASGNGLLAAAAMRAVRGWRYRPLILDGKAVAVACEIRVHFGLP